jgi:hypothetical protein
VRTRALAMASAKARRVVVFIRVVLLLPDVPAVRGSGALGSAAMDAPVAIIVRFPTVLLAS